MIRYVFYVMLLLFSVNAQALVATFTAADLSAALRKSQTSDNEIVNMLGAPIIKALNDAGLSLDESLLFESYPPDITDPGCGEFTRTRDQHVTVRVNPQSRFEFVLDALNKPMVVTFVASGTVDANGKIDYRTGTKIFGKCYRHVSLSGAYAADADVQVTFTLVLTLNPEYVQHADGTAAVKISPNVTLKGNITKLSDVNIVIRGLNPQTVALSPFLNGIIGTTSALNNEEIWTQQTNIADGAYKTALERKAAELNKKIATELGGASREFPIPDDINNVKVLTTIANSSVSAFAQFPVAYEYVMENRNLMLYHLLAGGFDQLGKVLAIGAACDYSQRLTVAMLTMPAPPDFEATSYASYCEDAVPTVGSATNTRLGNAGIWSNDPRYPNGERPWTLTPGNKFDVGLVSIKGNYQPYMKRVRYKGVPATFDHYALNDDYKMSIDTCVSLLTNYEDSYEGLLCFRYLRSDIESYRNLPVYKDDSCQLEMRIYKKNTAATKLKPLMMVHGGSWKTRGFGFFGLESQISHFTEKGFVVYAPFYRLAGSEDGSIGCNSRSSNEITADINDALNWIVINQSRYGSEGKPALMGQSAGAHLVSWLATKRPGDVGKVLAMYPPTDATDYIEQYRANLIGNSLGVNALETFLGKDLKTIDLYNTAVLDNSLPQKVVTSASLYPPFFLIHGGADDLVPSRQSVRMCNGLSGAIGAPVNGPAINDGGNPAQGGYKNIYYCNSAKDSRLHLIAEANHALDFCVPMAQCPAGSATSQAVTRYSLNEAYNWLADQSYMPWFPIIINMLLM